MRYLLLTVEPRGQRETRSEEEGRALYAEMVRFGEGHRRTGAVRGAARLASVLEVVCLIFNEGYAATTGDDWVRPALRQEALRLGRIIAGLMPFESGVHGLVALMEIQTSRLHARVAPRGSPSCCSTRTAPAGIICSFVVAWLRSNARPVPSRPTGPASLRCTTRSPGLPPSPVVELNRAVAVAMAFGPAAGLQIVDALLAEPALKTYHLLPSVRGNLLARLDRVHEARAEFERAATLTRNARERALLLKRAAACSAGKHVMGPDE